MANKIRIGDKLVGEGEPCFIIAEAGSNHNGKLEQAKKLIDTAAEAGADAIKFQLFKADKLSSEIEVQKILESVEFNRGWLDELVNYSDKKKIIFCATPFDEEAVDILEEADVPFYKIASSDLTHYPLLRYIAYKGKPIVMSVGLAKTDEITDALTQIYTAGNQNVALLHCVADYPAKEEDVNLGLIELMKKMFKVPVGFSDHTLGIGVPIGAVAVGADLIEKHFTLNKKLPGPDHFFSVEPQELNAMIKGIREVERALGSEEKGLRESEKAGLKVGRRSIYAKVNIKKDEIITKEKLIILRPLANIKPKDFEKVIGKKAKKDINAYEPLDWDKLGD